VQFSDSSDFATQWRWNFGDGTPLSNQKNPSHTYTINGTYTVSLIATYNSTCSDTIVKTAYIDVTDPVQYTTTVSDTASCAAPFQVNFTATPAGTAT
jgi:PKD repeat protein